MNRRCATDICAGFPGATLEHPFGPKIEAWKVGGKIFAMVSPKGGGLCLKCSNPETAEFLIDIGAARPAPYIKRGSWIELCWSCLDAGVMDEADLALRLRGSYDTVCAGLPRRLRPITTPTSRQQSASCRT